MNHPKPSAEVKAVAVATADDLRETIRRKSKLKGRQADDVSLAEVRQLIGAAADRRDLLIENLHKLNDEYRALHDRHLVALAKEMNLPMAEVYEVATFYHHFEVVRGNDPVADITLRVCDGIACELAGAQNLLAKLPAILGNPKIKVEAAPCVGRCEQAPVAVVHQYPVLFATTDKVAAAVKNNLTTQPMAKDSASFDPAALAEKGVSPQGENQSVSPDYVGYESYRAQGGYA
jgi:NADH:ubiquinone oxidoreductase subunit E